MAARKNNTREREDRLIARATRILERRLRGGEERYSIGGCADLVSYLRLLLAEREREAFWCVFLDSQRRVLGAEQLFEGTLTETPVYAREIARRALHHNAHGVILAHNHPCGAPLFSDADEAITIGVRDALPPLGVELVDHFLVAGAVAISLRQNETAKIRFSFWQERSIGPGGPPTRPELHAAIKHAPRNR